MVRAFAQYKPNEAGDATSRGQLQVLEIEDGKIVEFTFFLDVERAFPLFGLPLECPASARSGVAARKHVGQAHELDQARSSGDALPQSPIRQPWRRAASWKARQRVDGDSVDPDALTSQIPRRRSTRAGGRPVGRGREGPRVIGPRSRTRA